MQHHCHCVDEEDRVSLPFLLPCARQTMMTTTMTADYCVLFVHKLLDPPTEEYICIVSVYVYICIAESVITRKSNSTSSSVLSTHSKNLRH